jgi:hypothetical protein
VLWNAKKVVQSFPQTLLQIVMRDVDVFACILFVIFNVGCRVQGIRSHSRDLARS